MTATMNLGVGKGYSSDAVTLMAYQALREIAASWLVSPLVQETPHLLAHWRRVHESALEAESAARWCLGGI
jgi:hypothetical protein